MRDLTPPPIAPNDEYVTDVYHSLMKERIDDKAHIANSGTLYMRRVILGRLMARYEAFKLSMDLPGSIVELGVFKGESLLFFAKLVEIMLANDRSCRVIGFDSFEGFPSLHEKDGKENLKADLRVGGWSSRDYYEELKVLLNVFDHDRGAGNKPRVELIKGDISRTVPEYAEANPGMRIKLLHLDCDLYEPTLVGLQTLYDRVVKGGVILLDEYGLTEYPGESRAVDEFFADKPVTIKKFPFYTTPGGYIIK